MNQDTATKLSDLHFDMLSGQIPQTGYPDPLDLLRVLRANPDLPETMEFWEFRKAYDWLIEARGQNQNNGRHRFIDHVELADRAGCGSAVMIAAATEMGLKANHDDLYRAYKFPPFKS